jgi:hypothetical protein
MRHQAPPKTKSSARARDSRPQMNSKTNAKTTEFFRQNLPAEGDRRK